MKCGKFATARRTLREPLRAAFLVGVIAGSFACGADTTTPGSTIDAGSDSSPATDASIADDVATVDVPPNPSTDSSTDPSADNRPPIDRDAGIECRALAIARGSRPPDGVCPADAGAPPFRRYACLPVPESGTCEDAYGEACILNTYECALTRRADGIWCGPMIDSAGQCCYVTFGDCLID